VAESRDDNVIRVAFDRGQGRRTAGDGGAAEARRREGEGVASMYDRAEAARIVGVDEARLRTWERGGIARPSGGSNGTKRYTFQDLVMLRAARELVDRGIAVARIQKALDALRRSLPVADHLGDVRVLSDGLNVVVRSGQTTFDPVSGQLVMDFSVGALRDDVVRALPLRAEPRTAYDWYLEGCRLDGDETSHGPAEAAYRRALELDPTLAGACTNLGTLRLAARDRREAEALFKRAMLSDPEQPEAPYNLGFLALEAGDAAGAIELLERALSLDDGFADAHFNLAVAHEEVGHKARALTHWMAYLALEPDGPWAPVARARIRRLE
jgi:tetratricopeptide (TPR) repeat protein